MKDIKISIIIPVYGVERYIEQCINSVLSQTYQNFECIIVDDCGSDRSIEIAKDLIAKNQGIAKYTIITRVNNGGLSAARNTGLREAKGDYVYFLDSDDMLFPESISTLVHFAEIHPKVDIIQGGIEVQNGNNYFKTAQMDFPEFSDDLGFVRASLINGLPPTAWNKLIRKSFLDDNDISFREGIIHEDEFFRWDLHRYAKTMCFTKEVTYWYRTDNQNSIMKSSNQLRSLRSSIMLVREISPELRNISEVEFAIYNLKLRKATRMVSINDKRIITDEINQLRKSTSLPPALKFELLMWNLPLWMLRSTLILAICFGIRKLLLFLSK